MEKITVQVVDNILVQEQMLMVMMEMMVSQVVLLLDLQVEVVDLVEKRDLLE